MSEKSVCGWRIPRMIESDGRESEDECRKMLSKRLGENERGRWCNKNK